mmetsp:Transcript_3717/g.6362  ORF Transcript_3717/g.6362 Transcript_3717/m.6362 type:complete len:118 (-) Transcript_3717:72-425(-)
MNVRSSCQFLAQLLKTCSRSEAVSGARSKPLPPPPPLRQRASECEREQASSRTPPTLTRYLWRHLHHHSVAVGFDSMLTRQSNNLRPGGPGVGSTIASLRRRKLWRNLPQWHCQSPA